MERLVRVLPLRAHIDSMFSVVEKAQHDPHDSWL
jgi:hypothetical protein